MMNYLVIETQLNSKITAVSHNLPTGHQSVNRHLGNRGQVCHMSERYGDLSFIDWATKQKDSEPWSVTVALSHTQVLHKYGF